MIDQLRAGMSFGECVFVVFRW